MIVVSKSVTYSGIEVFASVTPSIPYFRFKRDGRSVKYWLKGIINRKWSEPHIRWWIEVYSDLDGASHHIDHDTGAVTLRQAINKASLAVERVLEEIATKDKEQL